MKRYGTSVALNKRCWIGIDQSYSGFSVTLIDENDNYETIVTKFDGVGGLRLLNVQLFIKDILDRHPSTIKDIAIEGYAFGSQMANKLGELGGIVRLTLAQYGYNPLVVPPTSLKKYVTGKGNIQKNQMLLHVYKKWGVEFTDDNAADSYALAKIAKGDYSAGYEKMVIDKLSSVEFRDHDGQIHP